MYSLDIDAILFSQSTGRNSLLRSAALKHSVPILIKIQWHLCSSVLPGNYGCCFISIVPWSRNNVSFSATRIWERGKPWITPLQIMAGDRRWDPRAEQVLWNARGPRPSSVPRSPPSSLRVLEHMFWSMIYFPHQLRASTNHGIKRLHLCWIILSFILYLYISLLKYANVKQQWDGL